MSKINIPLEILELSKSMKEQEMINEQYDLVMAELNENRKRFDSFKKEKEIQAVIKQKKRNHD